MPTAPLWTMLLHYLLGAPGGWFWMGPFSARLHHFLLAFFCESVEGEAVSSSLFRQGGSCADAPKSILCTRLKGQEGSALEPRSIFSFSFARTTPLSLAEAVGSMGVTWYGILTRVLIHLQNAAAEFVAGWWCLVGDDQ